MERKRPLIQRPHVKYPLLLAGVLGFLGAPMYISFILLTSDREPADVIRGQAEGVVGVFPDWEIPVPEFLTLPVPGTPVEFAIYGIIVIVLFLVWVGLVVVVGSSILGDEKMFHR